MEYKDAQADMNNEIEKMQNLFEYYLTKSDQAFFCYF